METLAERIARQKAQLQAAGPRIVLLQATTGLALIRLRIQRDGLPGKRYSTQLVPTFLFGNKALNAAGRDYVKRNKLGTWGGFRAAQGLQSAVVDLTYSGRMFNSLNAANSGGGGSVFTAKLVAADQESARKLGYNQRRYGDFLQPSAQETRLVGEAGAREIQRILSQ